MLFPSSSLSPPQLLPVSTFSRSSSALGAGQYSLPLSQIPVEIPLSQTYKSTLTSPQPLAVNVTDQRRSPFNDPHDGYERSRPYRLSSSRQKQQLVYESHRDHTSSRPSSSSGHASHVLRRSPKFDDIRTIRHRRSQSLDSAALHHQSRSHPAVRISQRKRAAILYALEEALRTPQEFTTDWEELNAQMSDLGAHGWDGYGPSATTRAEQVVQPSISSGALRMQDIARSAEDRQRRRLEEERRKAADRRAAAAAPGRTTADQRGTPAVATAAHYVTSSDATLPTKTSIREAQAAGYAQPPTQSQDESRTATYARTRGSSRVADEIRSDYQQPTSTTRRAQPSTTGLRQSSAPATSAPTANTTGQEGSSEARQTRNTTSSFPHAFERWENLSAHWEGLTSYWIHKLESSKEQMEKNVPTASAMSRQITDLSAAGANLFHAVVELQRLRASSERKFQRWFLETRTEQERTQEELANLQKALEIEKNASRDLHAERARALQDKQAADILVRDMRRELHISKEEARRAWEELGRREQEERDRIVSLREGKPTVVGEVQVVPMHASQASRSEGPQSVYTYEEGPSPTDTDPFSEAARAQAARRDADRPPRTAPTYQAYQSGSNSVASEAAPTGPASLQRPNESQTTIRPVTRAGQLPVPTSNDGVEPTEFIPIASSNPSSQEPIRFYQQPPRSATLNPSEAERLAEDPSSSNTAAPGVVRSPRSGDNRSEISYISSMSDSPETEYEVDPRTGSGSRDVHRGPTDQGARERRGTLETEISDDYDIEADIAREREHAAHYGVGRSLPATSAEAMASINAPAGVESVISPTATATDEVQRAQRQQDVSSPDYAGEGYGSSWSGLREHHHPTRLSDVMEEEEERSRASHGSRH